MFKLAGLATLYSERLEQLGINIDYHSTRLKKLAHHPEMKVYLKGRDGFLSFDSDTGNILHNAHDYMHENDAILIAKTAKVIRREIFSVS